MWTSFARGSRVSLGVVWLSTVALLWLALLISGCSSKVEPANLTGDWRAVLASPGGELPFTLTVEDDGGWLRAVAQNGDERAPFSHVELEGNRVVFRLDFYDAEIEATMVAEGRLEGRWRKTASEGDSTLAFTATKGLASRFTEAVEPAPGASTVQEIDGAWAVEFSDEDGTELARGELQQNGDRVTGTFLTPTGDYRFLEGSYEQGVLRLSTFDGAHAFLFRAQAQADGTLVGDFWSRDSYHAKWTARRLETDESILPDAWQQVGLTNDQGTFSFSFPDLEGNSLSLDDPRFKNKVVLVNIFGTWCPNCNDEAPLLATWHRRFRDQGLEVVGLAYEFTGNPQRDSAMVERFAERYSIQYPLLLAGTSDKKKAAETLPDLTSVVAFPTTIFIGRDGKVRKIHSGFAGPGTGSHHAELVAELESLIRELLAER